MIHIDKNLQIFTASDDNCNFSENGGEDDDGDDNICNFSESGEYVDDCNDGGSSLILESSTVSMMGRLMMSGIQIACRLHSGPQSCLSSLSACSRNLSRHLVRGFCDILRLVLVLCLD